ncbi:MAG: flagellar export protein FliJ [Clostridia bacterium]
MARFNYRLQTVLNVKKQMEDKAKNELANTIQTLHQEEQKLEKIINERDNCYHSVMIESKEGLNVQRLITYNRYLNAVNLQMNIQHKNVNNASENVDIYREKLVDMSKEKKMLETLKDKKLQEYRFDELKVEEKRIEEIVSYKFIRA